MILRFGRIVKKLWRLKVLNTVFCVVMVQFHFEEKVIILVG